jgi:hypothetical protein
MHPKCAKIDHLYVRRLYVFSNFSGGISYGSLLIRERWIRKISRSRKEREEDGIVNWPTRRLEPSVAIAGDLQAANESDLTVELAGL